MSRRFFAAPFTLQRGAALALPGLAGMLALLLAAEWLIPSPPAMPTAAPGLPQAIAPGTDDAAGQWAATALARPLFSQSRRPDAAAGTSAAGTLPRLSAIIMTGNRGVAIFSADGEPPQTVGVGGAIGGYQLQSINATSVTLRGPGGGLTLHPQFGASDGAGAAALSTAPAADSSPAAGPAPPGPGADLGPYDAPLPRATPSSNPALYIEQND